MQNIYKAIGIALITVSIGLTGCATPLPKLNDTYSTEPSFGFANQFINQEKKVLTYTIPLK